MKYIVKILTILLLIIVTPAIVRSQDTGWERIDQGAIEDASFIVEKSLEIELPQRNRAFEKVPPLPSSPSSHTIRTFNFMSIIPEMSGLNIPNRALKLKSQPLDKFYGGNISAGIGNYLTPFVDASLFNKRENKYAVGFNFNHISSRNGPVDKNNSGSSDTKAAFESKYYGHELTVGAHLNYSREMVHYYGYPEGLVIRTDSIKQIYNAYNIGLWLGNTDKKDDFDYMLGADFNHIQDKNGNSESKMEIDLETDYFLRDGLKFYLDVNTMFSGYNSLDKLSRNLIKVKPYVYYRYNDFDIRGGLSFVFQNDTLSSRSDVLMYPFIKIDYAFNDYFKLFLKIDGDLEQVDFQSIVDENPYLYEGVALLHSNRKFGIDWGIQGNIVHDLNFLAGFRLSEYKDLYFFMNDSVDLSRFKIVYDHENTTVLNFYGELVYSRVKNYNIALRADYFNYDTKTLMEAWHRPIYQLTGTFRYYLYDKIVFGSNIYFIGGIKAYDFTRSETTRLSGIVDLNLSVNYLFSERLGALLRFNNILGRNYERYWRYPSRGIQVLGGISINF